MWKFEKRFSLLPLFHADSKENWRGLQPPHNSWAPKKAAGKNLSDWCEMIQLWYLSLFCDIIDKNVWIFVLKTGCHFSEPQSLRHDLCPWFLNFLEIIHTLFLLSLLPLNAPFTLSRDKLSIAGVSIAFMSTEDNSGAEIVSFAPFGRFQCAFAGCVLCNLAQLPNPRPQDARVMPLPPRSHQLPHNLPCYARLKSNGDFLAGQYPIMIRKWLSVFIVGKITETAAKKRSLNQARVKHKTQSSNSIKLSCDTK